MSAASGKPLLLLVDDDPLIVDSLTYLLGDEFVVYGVADRPSALAWLAAHANPPDLALVDLGLPPTPHRPDEGFALIDELLARAPKMPIAILSGQNESRHARHALTLGAVEFIAKPIAAEQLLAVLKRLLAAQQTATTGNLIGESPPMQRLRRQLQHYAEAPFPVLIEGESGVGKEIVAATLRHLSSRRDQPYLALNCAAIAPTLIEATLFGHARGAYTGAASAQAGFFEEAGQGILLLDEIGELPLELQPKLLRVLENGVFQRLGETQERHTQARVLAITNRDLKQEVRANRFRADLYHRLSVLTIHVPPLRERGEDRLLLLDHFRRETSRQLAVTPFSLTPEAVQRWLAYPFPGNVRELRNIVIRLAIHHPGQKIDATSLEEEFDPFLDLAGAQGGEALHPRWLAGSLTRDELIARATRELRERQDFSLHQALLAIEEAYIEAAYRLAAGNLSQAARLLGMQRTTLYHRLETLRQRAENSQQ